MSARARSRKSQILRLTYFLLVIGLIWMILESLGYGFLSRRTAQPLASPITSTSTFTASEAMGGFTITVPEGFEVEEKITSIILSKNGKQVIIGRYASNFENLDYHLKSLHEKNKVTITESKKTIIEGFEANWEIIEFNATQRQKIYYVFVNGYIYDFSTNTTDLYSTLDQIAQSFRVAKE